MNKRIKKIKCGLTGHDFKKFATFHQSRRVIYLCDCGKKKEVKQ